ncbi:hypothetical protein [Wenzhouxiangella sp. EGI_FJ10305]|uniref:hypothetical protein n=1 Tax=Wenzhouxiangella sp. EGI_FJ10305 TaxID=3243768 RepID=UPI0035E01665
MSRPGNMVSVILIASALASPALAAEFIIVNLDDPNEGLNDITAVSPEGGNSGTTLGEQRMMVLEEAAARWAEFLELSVDIRVGAKFDVLDCSETSGILGSAGPDFVDRDFTGAPNADTWYPIALADTLRGSNTLGPDQEHIGSTYNVKLDDGDSACLGGATWYYGLDGNVPSGEIPLFPVVLHELGHGLGFTTFVDLENGTKFNGDDDVFMQFLRDQETGKQWPTMTDQERADSALNNPEVVWTGSNVDEQSDIVTASAAFNGGLLRMHAPDPLEGGSSISHWTTDADPALLMEPVIDGSLWDQVDLTPALLEDIGWPVRVLSLIFEDRFEN